MKQFEAQVHMLVLAYEGVVDFVFSKVTNLNIDFIFVSLHRNFFACNDILHVAVYSNNLVQCLIIFIRQLDDFDKIQAYVILEDCLDIIAVDDMYK